MQYLSVDWRTLHTVAVFDYVCLLVICGYSEILSVDTGRCDYCRYGEM